ncbi:MAG: hypothetical protein M1816_001066 [Peltula sp. TS41687]|nr:MAG: hypothetical protein M1816_001066 [Peltula sp. TS41687]
MRPNILGLVVSLLLMTVTALPLPTGEQRAADRPWIPGRQKGQPRWQLPYDLDIGPPKLRSGYFDNLRGITKSQRQRLRGEYSTLYRKWASPVNLFLYIGTRQKMTTENAYAHPENPPPDAVREEVKEMIQSYMQREIARVQQRYGQARAVADMEKELREHEKALSALKDRDKCEARPAPAAAADECVQQAEVIERRVRDLRQQLANMKEQPKPKPKLHDTGQRRNDAMTVLAEGRNGNHLEPITNTKKLFKFDPLSLSQQAINLIVKGGDSIAQGKDNLARGITRVLSAVAKVDDGGGGGHDIMLPPASPRLGFVQGY